MAAQKRDTSISGDRNATDILKALEDVRVTTFLAADDIWLDWMRFTEAVILASREVARSGAGPSRLEEHPRVAAVESEIAPRYKEHWLEVAPLLARAAILLLSRTREWDDVLGVMFMTWVLGWVEKGQYFSPWDVCKINAQIALFPRGQISAPERLVLQLKDAWERGGLPVDALDEALATNNDDLILAVLTHFLPQWQGYFQPLTIADESGCGSGVMLLAALDEFPRWATTLTMVRVYGVDIDPLCVQTTRLNLLRYGQQAEGIICANTLTTPDAFARLAAVPLVAGEEAPEEQAPGEGAPGEEEEVPLSLWSLLQQQNAA